MPLPLPRLSTLKPSDGSKPAAIPGLLPGTTVASYQLQQACATIPLSFHEAPAPQREHPSHPNACHGIGTAACRRLKTWKLISDVGQITTHTAQPCLTHQEQPRHREQQTSTLGELRDASSNLRKAAFILYEQAKTLNSYQALITRTTEKSA